MELSPLLQSKCKLILHSNLSIDLWTLNTILYNSNPLLFPVPSKPVTHKSWCFTLLQRAMKTWIRKSHDNNELLSCLCKQSLRSTVEWIIIAFFCSWLNKLGLASIQYESTESNTAAGKASALCRHQSEHWFYLL